MIFGYCRVSTAEQAADGATSIAEQERKCQAIAQLRGASTYDFTCFKDAGVSGTVPLDQRPGGHEMLETASTGDVLVAVKLDRMFRSTIDALKTLEHLKARGIDVILADLSPEPVTGNGVGKLVFGLMAMFADFERERIAERMEDGRKGKRRAGGHCGGRAPYGFKIEGAGREAKLVVNMDEQKLMRTIIEMSKRNAPSTVIRLLAEKGITARDGKPIGFMQIKRILARYKEQNDAAKAAGRAAAAECRV